MLRSKLLLDKLLVVEHQNLNKQMLIVQLLTLVKKKNETFIYKLLTILS